MPYRATHAAVATHHQLPLPDDVASASESTDTVPDPYHSSILAGLRYNDPTSAVTSRALTIASSALSALKTVAITWEHVKLATTSDPTIYQPTLQPLQPHGAIPSKRSPNATYPTRIPTLSNTSAPWTSFTTEASTDIRTGPSSNQRMTALKFCLIACDAHSPPSAYLTSVPLMEA